MPLTQTLIPAYGDDYSNANLAIGAFLSGRDWYCKPENVYANVHDFEPGTTVRLRYADQRRVVITTVPTPLKEPANA